MGGWMRRFSDCSRRAPLVLYLSSVLRAVLEVYLSTRVSFVIIHLHKKYSPNQLRSQCHCQHEQAWRFVIELCELSVSLRQRLPASLGAENKVAMAQ